jgi:hypothetical protein
MATTIKADAAGDGAAELGVGLVHLKRNSHFTGIFDFLRLKDLWGRRRPKTTRKHRPHPQFLATHLSASAALPPLRTQYRRCIRAVFCAASANIARN